MHDLPSLTVCSGELMCLCDQQMECWRAVEAVEGEKQAARGKVVELESLRTLGSVS